MTDLRVVGIDPSLTRTGLCKADGRTVSVAPRAGRVEPGMPEWVSILAKCNVVRDWAWPHMAGADLVVMEEPMIVLPRPGGARGGFSAEEWQQLQSRLGAGVKLQALQWVLLQRLRAEGMADRVLRVNPAQIQGFARNGVERASFKGLAPKAKKAALEDLARDAGWAGPHAGGSNDDEAEAWLARAVGMHVLGDPVMEPTPYRDKRARQWAAELARYRRSAA